MATLKDILDEQERQKQLLAMMAIGGDERALGNYPPPPAQQPSQGNYSDMFDPSIPLPPARQYTGNTLADIARNPDPNWSQETKDALARRADLSGTLRVSHNGNDVSNLFDSGGGGQTQVQQPGFRNTLQIGDNAPVDLGRSQRSHDVWADGPQEIGRYQLANGTTEIIRKIPVMRDGRQSVGMERLIETPDYLNPAMVAKQKFDLNQAEIANKNKPYESAEDKAFARETAKTKGEADRAKQAAGIPGTPEYKKIQADNDSIAKAKSAKENFDRHADAMIKNIDMLIGDGGEVKQHPGLKNAVGQWDTMYPDAMVFKPTLNARRLGEALLNKASVQGLTDIRQEGTAPGSITEKEWPIFQSQGEVMSMSQGEDQYIKALKDKRDLLVQGKANVARNYNERLASRGGSQPASPASGSAASNNPAQPASEKVMSMQDVMDTAKSRGKTTDQVMKDARAAGFTIK